MEDGDPIEAERHEDLRVGLNDVELHESQQGKGDSHSLSVTGELLGQLSEMREEHKKGDDRRAK